MLQVLGQSIHDRLCRAEATRPSQGEEIGYLVWSHREGVTVGQVECMLRGQQCAADLVLTEGNPCTN